MGILISLLASMISVGVTAALLPGVDVDSITTLFLVAVVMGVINVFIKPIVHLVALPITLLTLGLFGLVINAIFVMVVSQIVPGFQVDGFLQALIFSVILSLVTSVVGKFVK